MVEQFVSEEAEQGADDGPQRVHRPVKAEYPTARGLVDVDDEQCVAWRTTEPLAESVDHTACQHARPAVAAATITLPSAAMP